MHRGSPSWWKAAVREALRVRMDAIRGAQRYGMKRAWQDVDAHRIEIRGCESYQPSLGRPSDVAIHVARLAALRYARAVAHGSRRKRLAWFWAESWTSIIGYGVSVANGRAGCCEE